MIAGAKRNPPSRVTFGPKTAWECHRGEPAPAVRDARPPTCSLYVHDRGGETADASRGTPAAKTARTACTRHDPMPERPSDRAHAVEASRAADASAHDHVQQLDEARGAMRERVLGEAAALTGGGDRGAFAIVGEHPGRALDAFLG